MCEAVKQYRVLRWLDRVFDARRDLSDARDRIREMDEDADRLKSSWPRRDGVRVRNAGDRVGEMLAAREERRGMLLEAAEATLSDARRVIAGARDANADAADAAFGYLLALLDGMSAADAARSVGVTVWAAKGYQRQGAAMVYDSDPARFPPTAEELSGGRAYGYWQFTANEPPGR